MGLFQKKVESVSTLPSYSIGQSKTVLIIGLGNPGKNYDGTRHNIGFRAVDDFAISNEFPNWTTKKDLKSEITSRIMGSIKVILAKPHTFMNDSGQAASNLQRFYKISNDHTVVVYDELAVPFGSLRTRLGGSDAGHNGVKSLIEHIGPEFGRLRLGIGSEISDKAEATDFVLGKFTKAEQGNLPAIIKESGVMLVEYIYGGQLPHDTRTVL